MSKKPEDIIRLDGNRFIVDKVNFVFSKKPPDWIVPDLQRMWRLAFELGFSQHKAQTKNFFYDLLDLEDYVKYDEL